MTARVGSGHPFLDEADDSLEDEGEEEASLKVFLVEPPAAGYGGGGKQQVGSLAVAGHHPGQNLLILALNF